MQVDSAAVADAINAAQGRQSNFTNPDSQGVLSQLISDRAMGRGLYAVEPGLQLSPEQIREIVETIENELPINSLSSERFEILINSSACDSFFPVETISADGV
jgi:hypothetical protein